jgi:integrase
MGEVEQTPLRLQERPTLKTACEAYLQGLPPGAIEENTRLTIQIHLKHLQAILGESRFLSQIRQAVLQEYVTTRASQKTRTGLGISAETIKKEVATASGLWRFAEGKGWVKGASPTRGLKYPKGREKPPFQTFSEIEARIVRGGLTENEVAELWESLILTCEDVEAFLDHVQEQSRHAFLYPMILAAAHTGARRSELIRSQVSDVDLDSGYLTLREKKRNHHRSTTRRVPLSQRLREALITFLDDEHPGGSHTFCLSGRLSRSRNSQDAIRPFRFPHQGSQLSRSHQNFGGF